MKHHNISNHTSFEFRRPRRAPSNEVQLRLMQERLRNIDRANRLALIDPIGLLL